MGAKVLSASWQQQLRSTEYSIALNGRRTYFWPQTNAAHTLSESKRCIRLRGISANFAVSELVCAPTYPVTGTSYLRTYSDHEVL